MISIHHHLLFNYYALCYYAVTSKTTIIEDA